MTLTLTYDDWKAAGERRYGPNLMSWRFRCPSCGHVATPADWKAAGADAGEVAFSCVGRHTPLPRQAFGGEGTGPCDYAGGGLFRLNPVTVSRERKEHNIFDFADAPLAERGIAAAQPAGSAS